MNSDKDNQSSASSGDSNLDIFKNAAKGLKSSSSVTDEADKADLAPTKDNQGADKKMLKGLNPMNSSESSQPSEASSAPVDPSDLIQQSIEAQLHKSQASDVARSKAIQNFQNKQANVPDKSNASNASNSSSSSANSAKAETNSKPESKKQTKPLSSFDKHLKALSKKHKASQNKKAKAHQAKVNKAKAQKKAKAEAEQKENDKRAKANLDKIKFIKNLTPQSADELIKAHQNKLNELKKKDFPFKPKQLHFFKKAHQTVLMYKANPNHMNKPRKWAIKDNKKYYAVMNLRKSLDNHFQKKQKKFSDSIKTILHHKQEAQAQQDLAFITGKRTFVQPEKHLNLAPKQTVKMFNQQLKKQREHKLNEDYVMNYGMANVMFRRNQLGDKDFLRALDSIRARTIIKKNHPAVQSVKDMLPYSKEAEPILKKNIYGIYSQSTADKDIVSNPVIDKVNQNVNKYRKEMMIYEKYQEASHQRPVNPEVQPDGNGSIQTDSYLREAHQHLSQYSKFQSREDPVIKRVQKELHRERRQGRPYYPQGYQKLIYHKENNYARAVLIAQLHIGHISNTLYPKDHQKALKINQNIYQARMALHHHEPFKKYLTPDTQRVFNVYFLAKKRGIFKNFSSKLNGLAVLSKHHKPQFKDRVGKVMSKATKAITPLKAKVKHKSNQIKRDLHNGLSR